MAVNFNYKYAYIRDNGLCTGVDDTTDYILDPHYVPIEDETINYLLKYYWPIPTTVTSFDDWQGFWYLDANHTELFEEGNA